MEGENQTTAKAAVPPKKTTKDPKTDPTFFPQLFWASAALSGVLLIAAAAIALFNRWRKRQAATADESIDQLTSYRSLYERGELSKEEFDRIRGRIVGRMKPEQAEPPPASLPDHPPAAEPPADTPPA